MDSMSLLEETRNLVRNRKRTITYPQIADNTGVTVAWLKAFSAGKYKDASYTRIEKVYKYLSSLS